MRPKGILEKVKKQGRNVLTVKESLNFIKRYKIPVADFEFVKSSEEAIEFAEKIGYPVVLKVISSQLIHKTDVNGIALDLKNEKGVKNSFRGIIHSVKRNVPNAKIDGMIVQKMVEGLNVIVGGKKDEQFDQCIMFGLGGIFVELFKEFSFRVCPINKKDAEEMIKETKAYGILKGYRGKIYDIKTLVDILLKTSKLLEKNQEIKELDINPVIVTQKNAFAVDARIIID